MDDANLILSLIRERLKEENRKSQSFDLFHLWSQRWQGGDATHELRAKYDTLEEEASQIQFEREFDEAETSYGRAAEDFGKKRDNLYAKYAAAREALFRKTIDAKKELKELYDARMETSKKTILCGR